MRCHRIHHPGSSGRAPARGMTLVEVLIVVALIAMLTGAVVFGSGMLSGSRQRAAATLVMSSVRLAMTRANAKGKPVRLVFDLQEHRVLLEESSGRMLRDSSVAGGAEAATEAEERARKEADRILEGPKAPRPRFTPVAEYGSEGKPLGERIRFRQVQTQHDEEPITDGRAYLYFWPGGGTERAAIQITRQGDDEGLTVMVSPLTGRAKIEPGNVALPESRFDDEEYSEREE